MPHATTDHFQPPTAEQVRVHLQRFAPTGPSPWAARWPLMVTTGLVVMLLLVQSLAAMLLIWPALTGLFVFMFVRTRKRRRQEAKVTRLQELAMLRHDRAALRAAWSALGEMTTVPPLHQRCVAIMGHTLSNLGAHAAAMAVYDHLLQHIMPEHPAAAQLRVQRAIAALECEHLSDADDALRSLRGQIPSDPPNALSAAYAYALLVQNVRTGHFGEAAEQAEDLRSALRPLGVEAGYGHALIALSFHTLTEHDQVLPSEDPTPARTWWHRATLLLSPATLIYRFPELAVVAERYDA